MPTFGVCTTLDNAPALREQGWDFVEIAVQAVLQGTVPDAEWTGRDALAASALPAPSANGLVPGDLKIVGPAVDDDALDAYMNTVVRRAGETGVTTLVFGSGAARNVPDGFDRDEAHRQIAAFLTRAAPVAARHGVTLVAEPLNRGECNVMNTVAECMTYVRAVGHPNVQCLVDSYHFWLEDEPLANLTAAMSSIRHVHVADRDGRLAPGEGGASDYRPFFAVLKRGDYDGRIAVECRGFDAADHGPRVLAYLRQQWASA